MPFGDEICIWKLEPPLFQKPKHTKIKNLCFWCMYISQKQFKNCLTVFVVSVHLKSFEYVSGTVFLILKAWRSNNLFMNVLLVSDFYISIPSAILSVTYQKKKKNPAILSVDNGFLTIFFIGWVWLPATTCSWNKAWRSSNAKFLCSYASAGSAGPAPRWTTRSWSCATNPTACGTNATAG